MIDRFEAILADAAPAVRLQAAANLHVIFEAAPDRVWDMAGSIATRESSAEVLSSMVNSSALMILSNADLPRTEALVGRIKDRLPEIGTAGSDPLHQALGGCIANLYVWRGSPRARAWLHECAADLAQYGSILNAFLFSLRPVFFFRYAADLTETKQLACNRAQEGLTLVLSEATTLATQSYESFKQANGDQERETFRSQYQAAESALEAGMNQLYFGSGAFRQDGQDGLGLPNAAAKSRFLNDYAEVLSLVARSHEPRTLHHLVELYEFLVPGSPSVVFDGISSALLEKGLEQGYQYESLGSTVAVRVIKRFIADYRAIFDDPARRGRLVQVLKMFSDAGWSEALKLLFELPDLLR